MKQINIHKIVAKPCSPGNSPTDCMKAFIRNHFGKTSKLPIRFTVPRLKSQPHGRPIPFTIFRDGSKSSFGPYIIRLEEITDSGNFNTFQIQIRELEGFYLAYINKNDKLQLTGKNLLELADVWARALGFNAIFLQDASEVRCNATHEDLSLILLYIFKHGQTWYEKQGFKLVTIHSDRQISTSDYENCKKRLRKITVATVMHELESAIDTITRVLKKSREIKNIIYSYPLQNIFIQNDISDTYQMLQDNYKTLSKAFIILRASIDNHSIRPTQTFAKAAIIINEKDCEVYSIIENTLLQAYKNPKLYTIPLNVKTRKKLYTIQLLDNLNYLSFMHRIAVFKRAVTYEPKPHSRRGRV